MLLSFDIDKAIASASYIIERNGGSTDMLPLIKTLYYADRSALIEWGNSITGDLLASLEKGPIVSTVYDLLKNKGTPQNQVRWNEQIDRPQNFRVVTKRVANTGVLSEREIEILEKSRQTINAIRGSIPDWFHKNCPEWENPGKSSIPIDPSTILRHAHKSEQEIRTLEESSQEIQFIKTLLSAG